MQLTLTGHQLDITPALREFVEGKLKRLQRHCDTMSDIHCILTVEKLLHRAEATAHMSGGTIHADATAEDMYAAVDALIDKLDRQVKKFKEKVTDHHAKEASKSRFRET
ncbi:MAG TPA: ribosome-associated translation inhibitor RaiA [Gammaproteobacteria bacterium]